MNMKLLSFAVVIIVAIIGLFLFLSWRKTHPTPISIQTVTPFVSENVYITQPLPNGLVSSPLIIKGQARGTWYFEASFPVRLMDSNGKQIAVEPAQAQSDWMTTEFVPFEVTLNFTTPTTNTGTLILEKDNPSSLPKYDAFISIPIRFR